MSKIVVTGGAGFVGSNLVDHLLINKNHVIIYDNLSRKGTEKNIEWLISKHGDKVHLIRGDIRDLCTLCHVLKDVEVIYHLAAQVAVTSSVEKPRVDFEINALGTLNVLESARTVGNFPIILFTSTNKVYGKINNVPLHEDKTRYVCGGGIAGISETQPLDFYSPYGCSKGAADQYVRDYARIYGLRTVVFRMSCIYGPRQLGNEDQGWVAHFVISNILGRGLNIYGDGKQVRDILYIDDLVDALELSVQQIDLTQGQIYNVGGGPNNTTSLLELIQLVEKISGKKIECSFHDWRPGDQKVYISSIDKIHKHLGWLPKTSVSEGTEKLYHWARSNLKLFV